MHLLMWNDTHTQSTAVANAKTIRIHDTNYIIVNPAVIHSKIL